MTFHAPLLLAVEGITRTTFGWGRIESNADFVLPVLATVGIMLFALLLYIRDVQELNPLIGTLLAMLRLVVFFALLLLYLQPQWQTEVDTARNSRALVLIDTSSSMGLTDVSAKDLTISRAGQIAQVLETTPFLDSLRRTHDVALYRFDSRLYPITTLGKLDKQETEPKNPEDLIEKTDWHKALTPSGSETRLGHGLRQLVLDERNAPISGVVVFSDGGQNAGTPVEAAIDVAEEANIPLFLVGMGSEQQPVNVRVYKLEALPRAYPGDPFTVSGLIQSQGTERQLEGKSIQVQLLRRADAKRGEKDLPGTGDLVANEEVILPADGESVPVKFELTLKETGRQTLCLKIKPPEDDDNPDDDLLEVDVELVDRKDRVLLFAGGPTREYRFLRTQLFRDRSMTVDVLLQSATEGISQEADALLDEFPTTREEMFEYDCLVAFDPDWKELSDTQLDLLEKWIGEQGGGLIAISGGVYTGEAITGWVQDPRMEKIRALYPIQFHRRISILETTVHSSESAWPLDFTREGLEAEYLWLADTETENQRAWAEFSGVYSNFPVQGPKPAATVLARFSDPLAGENDVQPVYFAEQFYGSGRVFYMGSGEMWRLRRVEEGHFERFYTRLVRHVSQGRLLRQSSRGLLMLGQDRLVLGATVEIRAQLTNVRLAPLEAVSVPLEVFRPDGGMSTIALRPDPSRLGTFLGRLTVLQEGVYRVELPVPESDDERLMRRLQVALPDLERQNPQRNGKLLTRIAKNSGGHYYPNLLAAIDPTRPDSLAASLKDRTKTITLVTASDPLWEETWMRWAMYLLCGLLCLEWLIRRLFRLA